MAGIQPSVGLITGLPIRETVDKLMQVAARPRDLLVARNKSLQEEQVALNSLTALVIAIQLAAKNLAKTSLFDGRSVASSQNSVLTATRNGVPAVGTYRFRPVRLAQTDQWATAPLPSAEATLSPGQLTVGVGGFLDTALALDVLNGGRGVQPGKIRITDRSGTSEIIDLRFARTVDDVIDAINGAELIRVRASTRGDSIVLEDLTGQTASNLRVENVAGTRTADDLGLGSVNVASSQAIGQDVVALGPTIQLSTLNDANGIELRNGVPELRVSFRDGSSPLLIDFGDFSRGEQFARGTTVAANGTHATLTFQAVHRGAAYDGVRVRFVDTGSVTQGNETVRYDATTKELTFDIDAGATTANDIVAALSANAEVGALFTATAGGNGTGLVSLTDSTVLSGGAAIAAPSQPKLADLLRVLNEADPQRLEARISSDGDHIELIDKTTGTGTFRIESASGSSAAERLGIAASSTTGLISSRRLLSGLRTTLLATLRGGEGTGALGQVRITNRAGVTTVVDLSAAETLDDVLQAINTAGAGVFAQLNAARNAIQIRDTSGGTGSLMIENADTTQSATRLGIAAQELSSQINGTPLYRQTVSRQTSLATYRYGQAVRTGSFTIKDTTGRTAAVNLSVLQPKTIGDVLDAINALGLGLEARINDQGDGIMLVDTANGSGRIEVTDVGASTAAADLRIAGRSQLRSVRGNSVQAIDGSTSLNVTIASGESLKDLVRRINQTGGPVSASLTQIGAAGGVQMTLTSAISGTKGQLLVYDPQNVLGFARVAQGQDALLAVGDGNNPILLSSPTNTFENPVEGLSITVSATSDQPVLVSVDRDVKSVTTNVKLLVDKYNETIKKLRELTKFDPENNVTGVLFGTTEALRVDMALARFASSPIRGAGKLQSLADVGITVNDDGTLSFDENRFAAKFNADAQAVRQFFTTEELGLAARLNATIERLAGAGNSLLVNRNQTLQRQIELNNSRIDTLNKRLDREREALLAQFLRLETLVSRMQNSLNALSNLQAVPPPVARNR